VFTNGKKKNFVMTTREEQTKAWKKYEQMFVVERISDMPAIDFYILAEEVFTQYVDDGMMPMLVFNLREANKEFYKSLLSDGFIPVRQYEFGSTQYLSVLIPDQTFVNQPITDQTLKKMDEQIYAIENPLGNLGDAVGYSTSYTVFFKALEKFGLREVFEKNYRLATYEFSKGEGGEGGEWNIVPPINPPDSFVKLHEYIRHEYRHAKVFKKYNVLWEEYTRIKNKIEEEDGKKSFLSRAGDYFFSFFRKKTDNTLENFYILRNDIQELLRLCCDIFSLVERFEAMARDNEIQNREDVTHLKEYIKRGHDEVTTFRNQLDGLVTGTIQGYIDSINDHMDKIEIESQKPAGQEKNGSFGIELTKSLYFLSLKINRDNGQDNDKLSIGVITEYIYSVKEYHKDEYPVSTEMVLSMLESLFTILHCKKVNDRAGLEKIRTLRLLEESINKTKNYNKLNNDNLELNSFLISLKKDYEHMKELAENYKTEISGATDLSKLGDLEQGGINELKEDYEVLIEHLNEGLEKATEGAIQRKELEISSLKNRQFIVNLEGELEKKKRSLRPETPPRPTPLPPQPQTLLPSQPQTPLPPQTPTADQDATSTEKVALLKTMITECRDAAEKYNRKMEQIHQTLLISQMRFETLKREKKKAQLKRLSLEAFALHNEFVAAQAKVNYFVDTRDKLKVLLERA
jgi:hypothetical protein